MIPERLLELRYKPDQLKEWEVCELFAHIDDQRHKINDLLNVLRWLVDLQNGPPLPKYEKDWNRTMKRAEDLLSK